MLRFGNLFLFSVEIKSKSSKNCFEIVAEKSVRDLLGGRSSFLELSTTGLWVSVSAPPKVGPRQRLFRGAAPFFWFTQKFHSGCH